MARTIFEILTIKPSDLSPQKLGPETTPFVKVKKAYLRKALEIHPDKRPESERQAANEQFKELNNAYSMVDTPKKLAHYMANYDQLSKAGAIPQNTAPAQDGQVDIYMTVPIVEKKDSKPIHPESVKFFLPKLSWFSSKDSFSKNFDYSGLLHALNNDHKKFDKQVGLSEKEAIAIAEQHSLNYKLVVVQLRVPLTSLGPEKLAEIDSKNENELNKKGVNPYFILEKKAPLLTKDHIMSVRPVNLNEHSFFVTRRKGFADLNLKDVWPEGHIQMNNTPRQAAALAATAGGPSMSSSQTSQAFKSQLAAIMPATLKDKVNDLIVKLSVEKDNYQRGDKKRDELNQQITALCELKNRASLEPEATKTIINDIKAEFKDSMKDSRIQELFNEYSGSEAETNVKFKI